jgi:photosystem II stability/assembly factor-like uncharacterized protein
MKWLSITLTLFSLTEFAFAGDVFVGDVFVLVEYEERGQAYDLLDDGWAVVEAHPSFCLILCSEERAGAIPGGRVVADGYETLYVIWNPGNRLLPDIEGTRLIDVPGKAQILVARAGDAMEYAAAGAELKLVNKAPIRKPLERPPLRTVGDIDPVSDQLIHEMIDKITPERYREIVETLSVGVTPTRYTPSIYFGLATDYVQTTFHEAPFLDVQKWHYEYELVEKERLTDTYWISENLGWIGTDIGYVLLTTDSGNNWDAYKCNGNVAKIEFTSEKVGFACGDDYFLATTDDGSMTWNEISITDYDGDFSLMSFADPLNGIIGSEDGTYYITGNGGFTWERREFPGVSDVNSVSFPNSNNIWIIVGIDELFRSLDGGNTWDDMSGGLPSGIYNQVWFNDENYGILTKYDGIIYTEDGGATWEEAPGYFLENPDNIYFLDVTTGWVSGNRGTIYRTDDGGKSWETQNAGNYRIGPIFFANRNGGWAINDRSEVYQTFNGGSTWTLVDLSLTNPTWENVIAEIEGTVNPDEVIIICGHYDSDSNDPYHLAPGAEDNASGSGGAIAAAEAMAGYEYESTVRFITFSGEENGIVGSEAYARAMAEKGENIVAVINMDMVAYLDEPVYDIRMGYNGFTELRDAVISTGVIYTPEIEIYAEDRSISDDWRFADYGFPAVGLIERGNDHFYPWTHTTEDLPEHLDFTYGAEVVRLAAAAAACLAGITGRRPDDGEANIIAYPNPARPSDAGITFANLPDDASITLYNIAGERVFERSGIIDNETVWTLVNDKSNPVASGVYVYRVTDGDGNRTTGKVAVIR